MNPIKTPADTKTGLYRAKTASVRVEQGLRAFINERDLKVGAILPSEVALSELFSVSRMTLRKALKRLSMEGIVASRPGIGHIVLSERPLRKHVLLFGLDPLSPRSSSFHQKLAYWLRKHFTEEETEPAFVVLDREDRAETKLSEVRRRLRVGEFAGAVLVHWSEHIAPLEQDILASALPYLSISTTSANPNRLVLAAKGLVSDAYEWLAKNNQLPAVAICNARSARDVKPMPDLSILTYNRVPEAYHLTRTALASDPSPKCLIVPDDVAQLHAQIAILEHARSAPPLLAHLAIKGDVFPGGVPRLLLEVDPQSVAAFCLLWLQGYSTTSQFGTIPIRPDIRLQS